MPRLADGHPSSDAVETDKKAAARSRTSLCQSTHDSIADGWQALSPPIAAQAKRRMARRTPLMGLFLATPSTGRSDAEEDPATPPLWKHSSGRFRIGSGRNGRRRLVAKRVTALDGSMRPSRSGRIPCSLPRSPSTVQMRLFFGVPTTRSSHLAWTYNRWRGNFR